MYTAGRLLTVCLSNCQSDIHALPPHSDQFNCQHFAWPPQQWTLRFASGLNLRVHSVIINSHSWFHTSKVDLLALDWVLNASGQDVLTTVFSIRARCLSASTVYQRSVGRLSKETGAHSPLLRKLRLLTCHFYWPLSPFRRDICRAPVTYRKMVQISTAMVLVLEEWLKGGRGWRRTVWHTAWHPIEQKGMRCMEIQRTWIPPGGGVVMEDQPKDTRDAEGWVVGGGPGWS